MNQKGTFPPTFEVIGNPPEAFINKLLQATSEVLTALPSDLRNLVLENNYTIRISGDDASLKGPRKLPNGTIYVPMEIRRDPEHYWNFVDKSLENIKAVIQHETWHFIDIELGIKYTGCPLSQSIGFRNTLRKCTEAIRESGTVHDLHQNTRYGIPLEYYFPKNLKNLEDIGIVQEAFAEIGSVLTGKGACNPRFVQDNYAEAMDFIKATLFKSLRFKFAFSHMVEGALGRV